jgi:hypothetical protein
MRCPVCKADNTQGPSCRRCKADLSLLFALEDARRQRLQAARQHLAQGRWADAARSAARADQMRTDEESRALRAVAHLLQGQLAAAWACYPRRPASTPAAQTNGF